MERFASCPCIDTATDQLKPVSSAYARYSPDAVFHDPIGLAKGLEAVVSSDPLSNSRSRLTSAQKAQFNSMPKVFESSVTKEYKVLDNPAVVSSLVSSHNSGY